MKESKFKMGSFFVKFFLLVGLVGLIFVVISIVKETSKKNKVQEEITKLQEEAQKISKNNSQIREKIAYLESREYQEKEAKDKLGLQGPDEQVVVIKPGIEKEVKEKASEESGDLINISVSKETPAYLKWWNYFFQY